MKIQSIILLKHINHHATPPNNHLQYHKEKEYLALAGQGSPHPPYYETTQG
jgi:hypothetical protein